MLQDVYKDYREAFKKAVRGSEMGQITGFITSAKEKGGKVTASLMIANANVSFDVGMTTHLYSLLRDRTLYELCFYQDGKIVGHYTIDGHQGTFSVYP